jgi:6-phosphogluconolactonase
MNILAPALRSFIMKIQNEAIRRHSTFRVAISGSEIKTVATALLSSSDDKIVYTKWNIFFTDEAALSLDNANSNYALLKAELLDKLPVSQHPTVHHIDSELLHDLEELRDSYEEQLIGEFNRDAGRWPCFDLILLGCGADGHTCGLFPEHELLKEDNRWVACLDDSPEAPAQRITLTLPVLNHAAIVAFIASGQGKAEILRTVLDDANVGLPCSLVRPLYPGQAYWFVDDAASERVCFPKSLFSF